MESTQGHALTFHNRQSRLVDQLRTLAAPVAAAIVVLIFYLPGALRQFGRFDDFVVLSASVDGNSDPLVEVWMSTGRLVPAAIGRLIVTRELAVSDLALGRVFSVLLISFVAGLLAFWIQRAFLTINRLLAGAMAVTFGVAFAFLPAATSAAYWAIMAPQLVGLATAMSAGVLLSFRWKSFGVFSLLGAGVLIALSAFSYQSLTFLALLAPFLSFGLRRSRKQEAPWRLALVPAGMVLAALSANVIWVILRGGVGSARLGAASLTDTLRWWLTDFLPRSFSLSVPNDVPSGLMWGLVALFLIVSPLFMGRRYVWLVFSALGGLGVTAAAFLVVRETYASHRATMALEMWVWGSALFCALILVDGLSRRSTVLQWTGVLAMGMTTLVGALTAHERAIQSIVVPNEIDWVNALCAAESIMIGAYSDGVVIVRSENAPGPERVESMDEFGTVSSQVPWSAKYLFLAGMQAVSGDPAAASSVEVVDFPNEPMSDLPIVFLDGSDCSP